VSATGNPMKTLLIVKAAVEVLAGLALGLVPSVVVPLLIGSPLDASSGVVVARMAGAALFTLGIACWLARKDSQSRAAIGLLVALLVYDAAVVAVLLYAHFGMGLYAIGLWPAIVLHSGLGIWTITLRDSLRRQS
jgi:hypothetical protein